MNDESKIEAILTWSDPAAQYLGSGGDTTELLDKDALWNLLTQGRRDTTGVVTSVTIFTHVPPEICPVCGNVESSCYYCGS